MAGHHFLSYSRFDAKEIAIRLVDELRAKQPSFYLWLDKRDIEPGKDWDEQVVEAIRSCDSLVFVMTQDSVQAQSGCKPEWTRALKYKKPIVPLLLAKDAEMPFRLGSRQYIDFTGDFETAMAKLRLHLKWLGSPEGVLQLLKDRRSDAQRDLARSQDAIEEERIREEIKDLDKQITTQESVVADPEAAAERVNQNISRGLERERQPAEQAASKRTTSKFINPPPGLAPSYFQDRLIETQLVGEFLKDDSKRIMTVVGRAGIGKTAMVCRVLKGVESGHLPDNGEHLHADGIVYLSHSGSRHVNFPNLYADLLRLLPEDKANGLEELYRTAQVGIDVQMQYLLQTFPQGRVVVLLDNFEDLIEPETQTIKDPDMRDALHVLLKSPHHGVKAILTTRIAPHQLALVEPGRQMRLELDKGLESPYAENILREMDMDGKVGLKKAPDVLLNEARLRTRGYPRALEALFAILSSDRHTSLREVLDDTLQLLPENVVEVLVGEAYSRIDATAQKIIQALALYARPVPPPAVDFLLQPYLPGVDSAPVLNRLVNMHFVRKESGRYYLHPVDSAYAAGRIPEGSKEDRGNTEAPPYTRFALLDRGAEYFKQVRMPRANWKSLEDLEPQLSEFDLRCKGNDYDTAAMVLEEIDFSYLHLWGHYRLLIELHERLKNKLSDTQINISHTINLALSLDRMGQFQQSISHYNQALNLSRELKDRNSEATCLGNLGSCYSSIGQTDRSIDYYKEALEIYRDIGYREGEVVPLGGLANQYAGMGLVDLAIDNYQQALLIVREFNLQEGETRELHNLAVLYYELGEIATTLDVFGQALKLARKIGYRLIESSVLCGKGDVMMDLNRIKEAKQYYNDAIEVADTIGSAQLQSNARLCLAAAHLICGDLDAALEIADAVKNYPWPNNDSELVVLLGVIQLRLSHIDSARKNFQTALNQVNAELSQGRKDYRILDIKGLNLSGLVLCGETEQLLEAIASYRAARAIHKGKGVIAEVTRLFDALAVCDTDGILSEVRAAAAGEVQ